MTQPPEYRMTDYALDLDYADLDRESRRHVADIVFDAVGVTIGAVRAGHASGRISEAYLTERGLGRGSATLWSGAGTGAPDAVALCNGTWAEVLDYQDTVVDPRNNGHAAVTIVPAAVAMAEEAGRGGRELVAAIAAGLEVTIAILRAIGRGHRAEGRGFRTTSIAAPIGAAMACAKLLDLDRRQALNAIGLAGACANNGLMPSLAPGAGAFGMDKDWVNGLSAQLAVNAALLAQRGMTASDAVVTGPRGVIASHAHGDARPLEVPAAGAPNLHCVALKKYAACYGVHTAMDAALELRRRHDLSPETIDRVEVRVKADSAQTLSGRSIANHMAARFSLPYSVASALVRGTVAMADFDEPAIGDPRVLAYMDRIEIVADDELTRFHQKTGGFPARVAVHAGDRRYERRVDYPAGSQQLPMTRDELVAKFSALTGDHWPAVHRSEIVAAFARLDQLADIHDLTRLFG